MSNNYLKTSRIPYNEKRKEFFSSRIYFVYALLAITGAYLIIFHGHYYHLRIINWLGVGLYFIGLTSTLDRFAGNYRQKINKNVRFGVVVFFILLGFFIAYILQAYYYSYQLKKYGKLTPAKVTNAYATRTSLGYDALLIYQINGRTFEQKVDNNDRLLKTGDTLEIYYSTKDPEIIATQQAMNE